MWPPSVRSAARLWSDRSSEVQRVGAGARAANEHRILANSDCAEPVFGRMRGWAAARAGEVVGEGAKRRALALVVPQRRWGRLLLAPARIWWRGASFFRLRPAETGAPIQDQAKSPGFGCCARRVLGVHLKETRSVFSMVSRQRDPSD